MKVLMVDHWLPSQTYALELSRKLAEHVELTLLTNLYFEPERESFQTLAVLESKVKEKGMASYLRGLARLYREAVLGNYDVIHIQTFKQPRFEIPAFQLAQKRGKKLVYTAHNILPHEGADQKEAELLKSWYRRCDAILVHNEHSRNVLLGFEPSIKEKVFVMPHGTYNDFAAFAQEKPHEKTVFLQFGMIRKYKGIDTLLKAASLLPEEAREKLSIVIAGNQRKELDDTDYRGMLEGYGLGDFVSLIPERIPDEQVPEFFNGSDCCLFPYKEIYGSGALLMAYSFRKPVIASDIPTFREETDGGKTGLLFQHEDAEALKDAMLRFLELGEAEKSAMRESIRDLCENKFSWAVSARTLANLYASL